MQKHRFSPAERYAVFKVHGDRCYICGEPIDMVTFQVDHVLPEALLDEPERLQLVLRLLGRAEDFGINSFENWLPACAPCNNRKRSMVWEPSPLVQLLLQRAGDRADQARRTAKATVNQRQLSDALLTLLRAYEVGTLSDEIRDQLRPLLEDYAEGRSPEADPQVVRLAPNFEATLYEVLSDDGAIEFVRGPYGVGGGPSSRGRVVPSGMRCGSCGLPYFTGSRCVVCGAMDDGD